MPGRSTMALGRNIDRIEWNIELIESKFEKTKSARKVAVMIRILTIFGRNRSSRRNLSFQKFSNEQKLSNQLNRSVDQSMVDFQRQLTFKTSNDRPGVRPGVRPDVRLDGRRRRACRQWRRKKNHLIEAAPFGRLDQM